MKRHPLRLLTPLLIIAGSAWADTPNTGDQVSTPPATSASAGTAADRHQTEVQGSDGARMETEHGQIALHGWAKGGFEAGLAQDQPMDQAQYGASLMLARLSAAYRNPRGFATRLQLDASRENVRMLDAVARLGPKYKTSLQVGRFKMPLSAEVLVPATQLVLPTRMLITDFAPSRAVGVLGTVPWAAANGDHHTFGGSVSLGAFDPVGNGVQVGSGSVLVASLDQGLARVGEVHVAVHLAGAVWVHPQQVTVPDGLAHLGHDRWHDLSVAAEGDGWTLSVEGLASHRVVPVASIPQTVTFEPSANWDMGLGALVAKRVRLAGELELEPAAGWDAVLRNEETVYRPSVAVNVHHDDWHVVDGVAYDVELAPDSGQAMHTLRATLQVGF